MSAVVKIKKALRTLPITDARNIAHWLENYLGKQWDLQIDRDAKAGRLDKLANQALAEYKASKARTLTTMRRHFASVTAPADLSSKKSYRRNWNKKRL